MLKKFQLPPMKGTEVFPNVLQAPMIVEMMIAVPEGEWHNDDRQTWAAVAEKMVQQQSAQIMQFVLAQRHNYSISSVPVSRTFATLPGLRLTYWNMSGTEKLTVEAFPRPDPKPPVDEDKPTDQVMLVLYAGHKLAAIKMRDIATAKVEYRATLKKSNWGSDFFMSAQTRPSKDYAPVYSPLAFGASITRKSTYVLTWVGDSKVASPKALRTNIVTATPVAFIPMLAASATHVYTPFDKFSADKTGIHGRAAAPDTTYAPWMITTTGEYCYGVQSETTYYRDLKHGLTIGSWEAKLPEQHQVYSERESKLLSPYYMSDAVYALIDPEINPEEGESPVISAYYAKRVDGAPQMVKDIKTPTGFAFDLTAKLDVPALVATPGKTFTPTTTTSITCEIHGVATTVNHTTYTFIPVYSGPSMSYNVVTNNNTARSSPYFDITYGSAAPVRERTTITTVGDMPPTYLMRVDNISTCPDFGGGGGQYFEEILSEAQYNDPATYLASCTTGGTTNVLRPPGGQINCFCFATNSWQPTWSAYTKGTYTFQYPGDTLQSPVRAVHVNSFPFALKLNGEVKPYYSVEATDVDDNRINVAHHTPYGATTNTLDFIPWLHADNGVHVVQGFGYGNAPGAPAERWLYLDGKEYGPKLANALGVTLDQIQMIVLDVPLARVKTFV